MPWYMQTSSAERRPKVDEQKPFGGTSAQNSACHVTKTHGEPATKPWATPENLREPATPPKCHCRPVPLPSSMPLPSPRPMMRCHHHRRRFVGGSSSPALPLGRIESGLRFDCGCWGLAFGASPCPKPEALDVPGVRVPASAVCVPASAQRGKGGGRR